LHFIVTVLPAGVVGLLIAVIISAGMSSTASELNALASTTVVDVYKRLFNDKGTDRHYLQASRWITLGWGIFAIAFANVCNQFGALIEAVNVLGSLFYGTVLGIFVSAFFVRFIKGQAVLLAGIVAELAVIAIFYLDIIPYLWLNAVGCLGVIALAILFQSIMGDKNPSSSKTLDSI
jgi:Na+/proline symporter